MKSLVEFIQECRQINEGKLDNKTIVKRLYEALGGPNIVVFDENKKVLDLVSNDDDGDAATNLINSYRYFASGKLAQEDDQLLRFARREGDRYVIDYIGFTEDKEESNKPNLLSIKEICESLMRYNK